MKVEDVDGFFDDLDSGSEGDQLVGATLANLPPQEAPSLQMVQSSASSRSQNVVRFETKPAVSTASLGEGPQTRSVCPQVDIPQWTFVGDSQSPTLVPTLLGSVDVDSDMQAGKWTASVVSTSPRSAELVGCTTDGLLGQATPPANR